jgi:uncharacterized membrane protein
MDAYTLIKTLHIISATILFGTGLGIASLMMFGHFCKDPAAHLFAAQLTVKMDFLFTLPAGIVQPLTGFWLVINGGFTWNERWLVSAYALYIIAGLSWLPVVAIQLKMKSQLEAKARGDSFDPLAYKRLFQLWFALGWPAFGGLIVMFWLMVAKPSW